MLISISRAALLIVGAVLMTACAGPRPASPIDVAVHPAASWRTAVPNNPTARVDPNWWSAFGDPTLADLVAKALARNPDIKTAAARMAQAEALSSLSRSQRWPTVTATVTRSRERSINPANGLSGEQTVFEPMLSLTYDADLFGRRAASSLAASARSAASEAAAANVRLTIAASTTRSFIALLAADARLQILHDTLLARGASLQIIRRRVSVGYASELDLSQAEVDYRATEQLVPPAEQAVRRTEDLLGVLMGENPRRIRRDGSSIEGLSVPVVPVALPSSLLSRRPDIVQGEEQLVAADRSLDAARAAFMPNLQISAGLGSFTSSLLRNDPIEIFSAGGSLLAPIFDFGRLRSQADAAAAARDQAAHAYRKLAITAFAEVEDALSGTQRAGEQLASLEAQRSDSLKTLRLATHRYRSGYATHLEQLDAQRGLLSTELAIVQARSEQLSASVSLYQALGGGWDSSTVRESNASRTARVNPSP